MLENLTDTDLVNRIRSGDPRAFETLHDRYRSELTRHAERVLGGRRSLAENVVQESLWRAHRAITTGDREVVLQAWLHRIVHAARSTSCASARSSAWRTASTAWAQPRTSSP